MNLYSALNPYRDYMPLAHRADSLVARGKSAEAEVILSQGLAGILGECRHATNETSELGLVLHHLADARRALGQLSHARTLGEEAVGTYDRHPDWPESERRHAVLVLEDVLLELGDWPAAEGLQKRELEELRQQLPSDAPELAGAYASLAHSLLAQKKFAEAERYARDSLAIRETGSSNDWRTFNSRSMLGASLLGQNKFAGTEELLKAGYDGMKKREDKIPVAVRSARLKEALERLTQFFAATNRPAPIPAGIAFASPDPSALRAEDISALRARLGQEVTVEGRIRDVSFTRNGNAVNIEFNGEASRILMLWVPPDAYVNLEAALQPMNVTNLVGRVVRATGSLQPCGSFRSDWKKDRIQIQLDEPSQLVIVSR